jgi:hypothetical protein
VGTYSELVGIAVPSFPALSALMIIVAVPATEKARRFIFSHPFVVTRGKKAHLYRLQIT